MTLDELIETLQAFRARYPSAGTAYVFCPVLLDDPSYERGEVQLGLVFAPADEDDDDDDDEAAAVH